MQGECFLCGAWGWVEEHHIFGSANRKLSEKYGLKVKLCAIKCHREGPRAAHQCAETAQELHEYGQRKFMKEQGATIDDFRARFGKNYLEVSSLKYRVKGETKVYVDLIVEAESEDEAMDIAYQELSSLTPYAGNGGTDKIVGTSMSTASLDIDDEIEWTRAEAM